MNPAVEWFLGSVLAIATVVASYLSVRTAIKRNESENSDRLTNTALKLIEPLEHRLEAIQAELATESALRRALEAKAHRLETELSVERAARAADAARFEAELAEQQARRQQQVGQLRAHIEALETFIRLNTDYDPENIANP